jgi:hypothetical protein
MITIRKNFPSNFCKKKHKFCKDLNVHLFHFYRVWEYIVILFCVQWVWAILNGLHLLSLSFLDALFISFMVIIIVTFSTKYSNTKLTRKNPIHYDI